MMLTIVKALVLIVLVLLAAVGVAAINALVYTITDEREMERMNNNKKNE